jgi:hypothetical protein
MVIFGSFAWYANGSTLLKFRSSRLLQIERHSRRAPKKLAALGGHYHFYKGKPRSELFGFLVDLVGSALHCIFRIANGLMNGALGLPAPGGRLQDGNSDWLGRLGLATCFLTAVPAAF